MCRNTQLYLHDFCIIQNYFVIYRCPTSGACVKKEWLCDGYNDCPDGDDEDSLLCKHADSQRKPTAAASEEHEGEEAVGSAPAPSVRRPNHLPLARARGEFRGKYRD